jgi:signal transduction histidine kinase
MVATSPRQGVELEITDDGRGFDPAEVGVGMGLVNMRERASSLSGGVFRLLGPGGGE